MFDQPADATVHGQSPAPAGMRELAPQPAARQASPPLPAASSSALYPGYGSSPLVGVAPVPEASGDRPGPDDSVIARDDHVEGTFTSRGTVHVMGSVKGRIEALRLYVDEGARVEADVVVDEAIIAGELIGNLMCRQRLEARPSGRLSGVIETYRVMLHEGASVEGEVRMLPEPGRAGVQTIRGSAPVRGGQEGQGSTRARGGDGTQPAGGLVQPPTAATVEVPPGTTPRSSARPATESASAEAVRVTPRSSSPAGNGTRSGV